MRYITLLLTAMLSVFAAVPAKAQAPFTTAFTYQGELTSDGTLAIGTYDFRFRLFDARENGNQIGSTICLDNVTISAGRFTARLDFGSGIFDGQTRYLEIEVRADAGQDCTDESNFTPLRRQELTPAPHATFAQTASTANTATTANFAPLAGLASNAATLNGQVPSFYQNAANLTGTLPDTRLSSNVARLNSNQTFTGLLNFTNPGNTFTGNGAGLTNLSGSSINPGTLTRASLSADLQSGVGAIVPDVSFAGSVATGDRPVCVAVSGSFAYVVNRGSNTLQIFNISNPSMPFLVGSVGTGSQPRSVAVSGSFAYVVNSTARTLQIFSISNPAAPTLLGSVATGIEPISVAVSGSFAYVVNLNSNTLQVFNVSNPATPTLAASVATGSTPTSVAIAGSSAYVVNFNSNTLQVFNISNPATPTLSGSASTGSRPFWVAVSGSFAYVVNSSSNTLQVFDVSNPTAPTLAGSAATGIEPSSVAVSGSVAYVANQNSSTLQVFSILNPAAPTLTGSVSTGLSPFTVAVLGSYVYVVNFGSNSLETFNVVSGVGFGAPLASTNLLGLNAARLNGRASSFYTDASNFTAGTLADARLSSNVPLLNATNAFTGDQQSFQGASGISIGQGIIQKGGTPLTAIADLGLYSQTSGGWMRFVTNNAQFAWFSDSGPGTNARMVLSPTGNLSVTGSLSKGGGSFKIDHPLDPENKYLYHSFVESPDMMNIYNGNTVTDANGYATITLPNYFEALNRDFRYQLTVIDESDDMDVFLWAKVVREVKDNQFTLRSSRGNLKVSWQVTGIRKDAWAEKNRIPNTVDKPNAEKGKYLHPEAFGKPASQSVSSPAADTLTTTK